MSDDAADAMKAYAARNMTAKAPFKDHTNWQLSEYDHQKLWDVHAIAASWVRYATKAEHYYQIARTLEALEGICNTLRGPERPVELSVDLRQPDWDVGCRIVVFSDYVELRRHSWSLGNFDCPEDEDRPILLEKSGGYEVYFERPSPGLYEWSHAYDDFVDLSKFEGVPKDQVVLSDLPEVNFQ
jgi:hypothetical protein